MERLLFDHPEGLTRSEIARRLEVDRSTIGRYLNSTGDLFPFMEDEKGKLYLNKTKYLTHVRLTMFELEALHLSARLFARVMKFPFPHASAALRKLAEAQGRVSPALAARICETADDMELYNQYYEDTQRNYRNLIEDLGRAISEQWIIQVRHFSSRQDCDQTYRLMPITLEPYHQGHSVHLLAWDITREPAHQRVLKIERIKEIDFEKRDPEGYKTIPLKEIRKSLKKAWGIYTSDEEPIKVVLHFSPEVAPRVKETNGKG